jgi:hypothetical protein
MFKPTLRRPAVTDTELFALLWFAAPTAADSGTFGGTFFARLAMRLLVRFGAGDCRTLIRRLVNYSFRQDLGPVVTALRERLGRLEGTHRPANRPQRKKGKRQ